MDIRKLNKHITISIVSCFCYLLLTTFYYHIDKNLKGFLFITSTFLIALLFISIFVFLLKGIKRILINRNQLSFKLFLPALICGVTLLYSCFSPYKLNSEMLESKIVLRACFEGTQNQAFIVFRDDKTFELNWSGIFFYDEWFTGTYFQNKDTLFLQYKTNKPARFGRLLLKSGESLISIDKPSDTTIYYVPFYLGYCKHLN